MLKSEHGTFTRFYITAFRRDATSQPIDLDLFYASNGVWSSDFSAAVLFNSFSAAEDTVKQTVRSTDFKFVVRSVNCQINGYDLGTVVV